MSACFVRSIERSLHQGTNDHKLQTMVSGISGSWVCEPECRILLFMWPLGIVRCSSRRLENELGPVAEAVFPREPNTPHFRNIPQVTLGIPTSFKVSSWIKRLLGFLGGWWKVVRTPAVQHREVRRATNASKIR